MAVVEPELELVLLPVLELSCGAHTHSQWLSVGYNVGDGSVIPRNGNSISVTFKAKFTSSPMQKLKLKQKPTHCGTHCPSSPASSSSCPL